MMASAIAAFVRINRFPAFSHFTHFFEMGRNAGTMAAATGCSFFDGLECSTIKVSVYLILVPIVVLGPLKVTLGPKPDEA
jgi:hypothetical protein